MRGADHDRFLTALFAPDPARTHLFALYAFNVELARIRQLVSEPLLGEIRLQWWREAIASAYGEGLPRAHPVALALGEAISASALPRGLFEALINARCMDLAEAPPAKLTELELYARASSSGLMHLSVLALGGREPDAAVLSALDHAGIGLALTGIVRAIGFHAAEGKVYLPLDLLNAEGLTPEAVLTSRCITSPLRHVILAITDRAVNHLAAARMTRPPRNVLPAFLPAVLCNNYIKIICRADFDPYQQQAPIPAFRQQLRLARAMLMRRI